MSSRRIKLTIEFDGSPFAGWQSQRHDDTVQATLEGALAKVLRHPVRLHGAGRTDAGVHACGMVAHFDSESRVPAERLPRAIKPHLPESIAIREAEEVDTEFDARRDALLRWYRYQIILDMTPRPLGPRAWKQSAQLDLPAMQRAMESFGGEHDFQGFRAAACTAKRTRLTLEEASLLQAGPVLSLDFKCRSFLQRMVRLLVGAVVEAGRGRLTQSQLSRILKTGRRPHTIRSAPAHGLCLMAVAYSPREARNILTDHRPPPTF